MFVEAAPMRGKGDLILTGQLGDVMKESARAALTYVTTHGVELAIPPERLGSIEAHVHVPAGAIPKDGPSAGVALVVALASLYSNIPTRSDTAMTGEITLTGLVMPVGGVKDKVLAARRAGLRRVILPKENLKDLRTLSEEVRQELTIIPVESASEALAAARPVPTT